MIKFKSIVIGSLSLAMMGASLFGQTVPSATTTEATAGPATQPMTQDEMPDSALHGEVVAVFVLDFQTGDKTAWYNTAMVMSGGRPTTRPLGPTDSLPMGMEQGLGPFFKMKVQRMVECFYVDGENLDISLSMRQAEGGSETAANDWLRRNTGSGTRFDHDGAWLIARVSANTGKAIRKEFPLSVRADEIRQLLNTWGDDVPLKAVNLSSQAFKDLAIRKNGQPPEAFQPFFDDYWNSKYIFIGMKLGTEPEVKAYWAAPDENGADSVIKNLAAMGKAIKQPNNNMGGMFFLGPIFDQCRPVREGNVVRISLNQKDLGNIFSGILVASMAQQRNNNGQAPATQTPVAADWTPVDAATDAAASQMRLILAAIAEYSREKNALPGKLDDLVTAKLVPGPEVFRDPRTNTENGFVYVQPAGVGKLSDIATPGKTGILYEGKNGAADQGGLIGYADGKVKIPK